MTKGLVWYQRWIEPLEDQMIRSIYRIIKNPHDAEDVLQNALTTIYHKSKLVESHLNPQALILRIAIDAAYDWLRKTIRRQSKHISVTDRMNSIHDRDPNVSQLMQQDELESEIITAIGRLPRKQSAAVLMRIVDDCSYKDIAQSMNCTESTVRIHVMRGRETLSRWLSHLNPQLAESVNQNEE